VRLGWLVYLSGGKQGVDISTNKGTLHTTGLMSIKLINFLDMTFEKDSSRYCRNELIVNMNASNHSKSTRHVAESPLNHNMSLQLLHMQRFHIYKPISKVTFEQRYQKPNSQKTFKVVNFFAKKNK